MSSAFASIHAIGMYDTVLGASSVYRYGQTRAPWWPRHTAGSACFREEEHMSLVTTQPEMLAWATENLQGVHRDAPTAIFNATQPANQPVEGQRIAQSHRGRETTDRILTTSQRAPHSARPTRLPMSTAVEN
jgi:hypothetical protein